MVAYGIAVKLCVKESKFRSEKEGLGEQLKVLIFIVTPNYFQKNVLLENKFENG